MKFFWREFPPAPRQRRPWSSILALALYFNIYETGSAFWPVCPSWRRYSHTYEDILHIFLWPPKTISDPLKFHSSPVHAPPELCGPLRVCNSFLRDHHLDVGWRNWPIHYYLNIWHLCYFTSLRVGRVLVSTLIVNPKWRWNTGKMDRVGCVTEAWH